MSSIMDVEYLNGGGGGVGDGRKHGSGADMMIDRIPISEDLLRPQLLTLREFRPFKTSDEYLWAMKEDLSDWLNVLYPELSITPNKFMECLETGVTLCKHANNVRRACVEWLNAGRKLPKCWGRNEWKLPTRDVIFNSNARPETFFARDNVHNFITWCRNLGIFECLLFESDDLILRKNEKNVILCLLEVARRGSHFGMATPLLVQFEKEIDRDIAKDTGADLSSSGEEEEISYQEYGPMPQIITNDLRSLDEMVRELVERCTCPTQFPMIRVAEGKYRIGNTKVMIYVRILRNHVMVRVGGGWDTLAHYLDKHDPCRCSSGHRAAISSKLTMKGDGLSAPRMKVEYERRDLSFDPVVHSTPTYTLNSKKPADLSDSSSEISDEGYKTSDNTKLLMGTSNNNSNNNSGSSSPNANNKEFLIKGQQQQSRRSSLQNTRTRSLTTDDHDRPDSRSTDEELNQSPPAKERSLSKSSSNGRVPRGYNGHQQSRSVSCERRPPQQRANNANNNHIESGQPQSLQIRPNPSATAAAASSALRFNQPRWNHNGKSQIKNSSQASKMLPPKRSLSASGTMDFYGNHSRYLNAHQQHPPNTRLNKSPTSTSVNMNNQRLAPTSNGQYHNHHNNSNRTPLSSSGKNTWNGNTSRSSSSSNPSRVRPNLFHANYFNNTDLEHQQKQQHSHQPEYDDQIPCSGNDEEEENTNSLNLAEWIKKALELDSDAAKISHIEQAIKQFEQHGPNTTNNLNNSNGMMIVPDFETVSLPYGTNFNDDHELSASSELPSLCSSLSIIGGGGIRKRKENGVTRIPKPKFF